MATINTHTFVTNFNADNQETSGVELMTDERGHMYPISKLFAGNTLGDALKVVAPSTSSLAVNITPGYAQIPRSDSDYSYLCWLEPVSASVTYSELSVTADSTYPRYSAIVAYIDTDIQYSTSQTNNPGLMKITEVTGTAAASPVEVDSSKIEAQLGTGTPYIVLAQVYIPAGASAITSTNIIDKRTAVSLREGVTLPYGSYATGVTPATGSSYSNNIQIAVINANDTVPTASSDTDILVCRISQ